MTKRLSKTKVIELIAAGTPTEEWDEQLFLAYSIEWNRLSRPIIDKMNAERKATWWSDYQIYLSSDEWKDRSLHTLQSAKYVCERCKRKKAIHVHHLCYERVGEERPEDLQALCFDCHDQAHEGRLSIDKMLVEFDAEFGLVLHEEQMPEQKTIPNDAVETGR